MQGRKLKVMQLGSPTGLYGAERWILALVRHLDPEKVTSIVASIKDDPDLGVPLCREADKLGFQTKVFNSLGRINFSAVTALYRYLKKEKIDILHTHGYKQDMIGFLAARSAGCRILSTPHGWSRDAGFKLQCYEGLNRMIFPFFDAVAPLSVELFDALKKIPAMASRLAYIPNGVDTDEIDDCQCIAKEILKWRRNGNFVVGYIGQLIPRKGLGTLLSAAAGLDPELNFRIALVGEGPQRTELEKMALRLGISHKIRFFGFREDRIAFLKGFDCFVLPSSLEGIPRCLMEAMAAGIPVLSSNIPGARQLIGNDENGRLFQVDDVPGLQRLLEQAIGTPQENRSPVASAHELIHSQFSSAKMAERYTKLFYSMSFRRAGRHALIDG